MFEFDENKSRANKQKHGIDFQESQKLWDDPNLLEIPAKSEDESRFFVFGKLNNLYWSAIITYRNSNIRIISVRRSRKEEIRIYESN
jgi:uncharacterized protein